VRQLKEEIQSELPLKESLGLGLLGVESSFVDSSEEELSTNSCGDDKQDDGDDNNSCDGKSGNETIGVSGSAKDDEKPPGGPRDHGNECCNGKARESSGLLDENLESSFVSLYIPESVQEKGDNTESEKKLLIEEL
jgi:hypothetical protein